MEDTFDAEVQRWMEFVSPVILSGFSLQSVTYDERHVQRHSSGLWHIYSFWLKDDDQPLKIGVAGPKSAARFDSQHYNPRSANSNLAKTLLRDGVCEEPAKAWILENTYRINLVFDGFSKSLAHALETHLHLVFNPRYEK